jgi:hypothetical protein
MVEVELGLATVCSRGLKSCAGDGEEEGTEDESERLTGGDDEDQRGRVNHSPGLRPMFLRLLG